MQTLLAHWSQRHLCCLGIGWRTSIPSPEAQILAAMPPLPSLQRKGTLLSLESQDLHVFLG